MDLLRGRPHHYPRTLTAFGETKTIAQRARDPRCPISYPVLRARADELPDGVSAEIIISTPAIRGRTRVSQAEPTPGGDPA